MIDTNSDYTVTQWGRRLPNGQVDWQTADDWTPAWSTQAGRDAERNAYRQSLSSLGITGTSQPQLTFLTRSKKVTYTPAQTIDDSTTGVN
jgi:hypothetical protein